MHNVVHRLPGMPEKKKPHIEPIIVDDNDNDDNGDTAGPSKPRSKSKEWEKSTPALEAPPIKKKRTTKLTKKVEEPITNHEEQQLQEQTWSLEEELHALNGKDLLVRSILKTMLLCEAIAPLCQEIHQAGWASFRVEAWCQYFNCTQRSEESEKVESEKAEQEGEVVDGQEGEQEQEGPKGEEEQEGKEEQSEGMEVDGQEGMA
ncbi:hypothetical protein L226DRAFT_522080 [Lentinus tigrinus ALCF2SS1-7]|uniref:uncharacterized protein n=1 Tax=Lentinus tigrinus ALCF2SS1-7 TaxID=1328758 RepID=UPI001165CC3A|nr:hypothetical protein L226DRAFT_522080 [Lentinus tigrinus ALCF2SS1-7]